MDIHCPFCSGPVTVPPGATEVECPSCRAGFDVEAARLMDEIGDSPQNAADEVGERRSLTEAWVREDVVAEVPDEARAPAGLADTGAREEGEPTAPEERPSRSTEAYLRGEGGQAGRPPGTYRFTRSDLRYAEEEVFVPRFRKAPGPADQPREPPSGKAVAGRPVPPPPVVPPLDLAVPPPPSGPSSPPRRGAPLLEDEGPARVVRRARDGGVPGRTASRLSDEERAAGGAQSTETRAEDPDPSRGLRVDEPFGTLDVEPAFDRFSWVGPEFRGSSGGTAQPPTDHPHEIGPAGGPPPPQPWLAETRKQSFSFPDLDVGPGPEAAEATGERAGDVLVGPESLDLSFDDLSLPEPVAGAAGRPPREAGGGGRGGHEVNALDIESVLKEDSDPEMAIPWGGDEAAPGPATGSPVPTPDRVPKAREAGGRGKPAADEGLGLPDQWLDFPEGKAEEGLPPAEDLPGFDLEGFPGGAGSAPGADLGPDLALDIGIREAPGVPPLEPVGTAKPSRGAAIRPVPRAGATGLRIALLGTFLVVLVGVILGQTQYGYFGFNLFVPSDETLATGRRAIPPPGATVGIAKDTPEAYRNEIVRIEAVLRDEPDNAKAKADLLEVMMRFRERFPAVMAADEKMERRLKQLEREAQVTGQKASMVRVLDLVNAGQFAEARAVLDGMVVATAQDADVLYFYGKIALGQGKFEEAQKYFELALLKNPASIAAKYFLARTRIARGEAGDGRKLLDEILAQEPGHLASKVLLAKMALGDKDTETASRLAGEVVLKADSQAYADDLFEAHLVLAGVHDAGGRGSERASELRAAIALRPTHQETAVALAGLLLAEGKQDDAISVLEPCWKEGCDSLAFLATYLEAVLAAGQDQRVAEVMARGAEKHPKSPDFAIIQGRHLLGLERPRAATTAFESAIAAAPDSAEAYLLLAEALGRDGKVGEAVRRLGEGVNRVRDRIPLLRRMASLYRDMRDFVSAEETLRQVLVMDPSNVEVQEQLGLVVLALGRAEEAVAVLGALHARQALGREGVLGLARAYLTMRKPGKAREVLARVYGKAEDDPIVATEYGRALAESGQVREAEGVLKKVLQDRPSFAPAHHAMGQVSGIKGETKAAVEHYMRAVQIDPRDTRYRLDLARVLKKQGTDESIRDAMTHLDNVVNAYGRGEVPVEDRQADAYVLRGEILFAQQKYAAAMKDFEAALALDPARMDILVGFGCALYELARYEEAMLYFRQVLGRDRTHPDANFFLGRILLRNGDIEEAKALFERVAQRSPGRYPEALRLLGLIYRDQNLKPLARKSFAAYLQHAPRGTAEAEEVRRILDRMR